MKRILASLFVTSVAVCSASAASAQVSATSVHTGTVPATCTVAATPGTLSTVATGTTSNSINSDTIPGLFTIICNSNHSLAVATLTGTSPATAADLGYRQEFRLFNDSVADATKSLNATTFSTTYTTVTALPVTSTTGRTVNVAARASVNTGSVLPAGTYIINVQATVTP
jgi:hypothetical protein